MRKQDKAATTAVPGASAPVGGGVVDPVVGNFITEGSFLPPPLPAYVDTPFGQKWMMGKNRAMSGKDVAFRTAVWAFDCKGYFDSNSEGSLTPVDFSSTERVYEDWYHLAREVISRTVTNDLLIAECLSNGNTLREYLNEWYTLVTDLGVLMNINRLPALNTAFSAMTHYLPKYMSRLTRCWRRASTLWTTPMIRAHALRNMQIPAFQPVLAPYIRFWRADYTSTYAPSLAVDHTVFDAMIDDAHLGAIVTWLEELERYLETSSSGNNDADRTLMKDMMSMSVQTMPGAFVQGLPDSKDLPGIVADKSLLTDILCRMQFAKNDVDSGTDTWVMAPVIGNATLQRRIPIIGYGTPGMYDYMSMGAPKFGCLGDTLDAIQADVDSVFFIDGTEHPVANNLNHTSGAADAIKDIFGAAIDEEFALENAVASTKVTKFAEYITGSPGALGAVMLGNHSMVQSIWAHLLPFMQTQSNSTPEAADISMDQIIGRIEEGDYDYLLYANPDDLSQNLAQVVAQALKVPNLYAAACHVGG